MTGQGIPVRAGAEGKADGRRTNTRTRIHEVALELFAELGYERTTMRQIADRLGITRPALYYHYRSKEDILAAVHRDLAYSVDELLAWAKAQPATGATRQEVLRRLHALMSGPWGIFTRFAQASEAAMRDLSAAAEFSQRMDDVGTLLSPSDTVEGRIKGRLALSALFMANARSAQLGGSTAERMDAALEIAYELVR
ncbi:TetR/AcrR family transcriptional regulator [Kitasatospora sp. NPDC048296]|uniref:TetR/AcrR family transcriptional regulator n=1 Tax=Kitasatospora sp. NPDC048296 TaxID=3364048 RepID=UPI003714DB2C